METSGHKPSKSKKQFKDNTDSRYIVYTKVSHLHFKKFFAKQGPQNQCNKIDKFPRTKNSLLMIRMNEIFPFLACYGQKFPESR